MHDLKFSLEGADHQKKEGEGEGGEWLLNARIGARGTILIVHRIAQKGDEKKCPLIQRLMLLVQGFAHIIAS